ncbi:hypothetical protein [Bradyrhizobium elkanii]|jgi:hypothetical protein|uniref:hypothetical protein n=1 Tax=Bradyrhizobium elkanii TaxID=29448 RepID=UPI00216835D5|nr:hypothetical protein [Bradyrhizobium elkanii]MCS3480277.1 hypothetical protein [Bradyrhizobium elkanii]MCW2130149.1 hypothetical protein [Bradyrhizobium elkanii]MCW2167826.1 hypothetical protein [Bradyrhizobium elkanii]
MAEKEKGRQEGSPIPNDGVWRDAAESKAPLLKLQAARLTRRCAISLAMASIVAPLFHGDAV